MIKKYPLLLAILLLFLITNCGSPIPSGSTGGEGSIAFKVEWKDAPTLQNPQSPFYKEGLNTIPTLEKGGEGGVEGEGVIPLNKGGQEVVPNSELRSDPLDCTAARVFDVEMAVYDSNKRNFARTGNLSCSAHSGAVTNVPEGSNLTLVFLGKDSGNLRYRGEVTGITVTANQTTDVGTITAYYFVPTMISPANTSTASSRTVTFSWSSVSTASYYTINIYNNLGTIDKADTTATTYTTTFPSSGEFYWILSAVDVYGNMSAHGQNGILNVP